MIMSVTLALIWPSLLYGQPPSTCNIDCLNGSCELHSYTSEYYCKCTQDSDGGYQGINCETSYTECTDGDKRNWRCLNDGLCHDLGCDCPESFSGLTCQNPKMSDQAENISPTIVPNAIQNPPSDCVLDCLNGPCELHPFTSEYYCKCPKDTEGGYQGINCETSYIECTDGDKRNWRCLNGGLCNDLGCDCPVSFSGITCLYPKTSDQTKNNSPTAKPSITQKSEVYDDNQTHDNYTSKQIEKESNSSNASSLGAGVVVGIVLALFTLFAVIFTLSFFKVFSSKGDRQRQMQWQFEGADVEIN